MDHWWADIDRGKTEVLGEKTCPSATFSTINLKLNYIQDFHFFLTENKSRLYYTGELLSCSLGI
jgi:hypothetical protein